jgi:hypothetical protein
VHKDGSAVQTSGKIGFCFGQVLPIDMRLRNAVLTPPPWLITNVPNGTYEIEITVNDNGRLWETTTADNRSLRTVILGGTPGHRTVSVPPVFGAGPQATRAESKGAFRFPLRATGLLGR